MIELEPMTEAAFASYLERAVKNYADEKVKAGNWSADEGLERAEHDFGVLLPDGPKTVNQHLFTLQTGNEPVGMIWFAEVRTQPRPTAFIYDFWIDEAQRRQGYGREALGALEAKVKELGLEAISLHVFGHNHTAIELYKQAGFEITNLNMTKDLAP